MLTMQHLSVLLLRARQAQEFGVSPEIETQITRSFNELGEAVQQDFNIFTSDTFIISGDQKLGPSTTRIHDTLETILEGVEPVVI